MFPKPIQVKFASSRLMNRWLVTDVKKWVDLIESGVVVSDIRWDEIKAKEQTQSQLDGLAGRFQNDPAKIGPWK
jgi:hypothetical protein